MMQPTRNGISLLVIFYRQIFHCNSLARFAPAKWKSTKLYCEKLCKYCVIIGTMLDFNIIQCVLDGFIFLFLIRSAIISEHSAALVTKIFKNSFSLYLFCDSWWRLLEFISFNWWYCLLTSNDGRSVSSEFF